MTRTLPRRERIRRRPEFLRVQQRGVRTRGRYLTIFALPNGREVSRLGIIATRRLGSATRRNRSKRLVREIYRQHKPTPSDTGVDLIVMPRPGFGQVPFEALRTDYLKTVRRYERTR